MFDDLIHKNKRKKEDINIDYNTANEECPFCRSRSVESTCGVFVSSYRYVQCMTCNDCGLRWKVVFNQDLKVTNVEIE